MRRPNRTMRRLKSAVLALAMCAAAPAWAEEFRREPWLADLDQLRDAMSAEYANLEWQAQRGLDLPAVYGLARQRLLAARDEAAARQAFERFLRRFADGHVQISWPAPATAGSAGPVQTPPLCARLGYFDIGEDGAVATRLPGFRPVGSATAAVRAGIVEAGGRRIGVLRLSLFDPHGFPALCDELLAAEKLAPDSPCDAACEARLSKAADSLLVRQMQGQLQAITAERPDVLLVDIAENGGGNDTAISLARMVTDRRPATPRLGLLRTPRWAKELADRQASIRAGLATARGEVRRQLQRMDEALTTARAEVGKPCDRAPLWRGEPIACSLAVTAPLYAGGMSADELPWVTDQPWAGVVSSTAQYPATRPIWRGPLMVLVDGNAASASELLAAMLQDSGSALILGSPSFGAGCGHMMDPEPVKLANSGATVSMPDCLRLRADGRNEVSGVEPDVFTGFRTFDTPQERTQRLARALPEALRRLDAKGR